MDYILILNFLTVDVFLEEIKNKIYNRSFNNKCIFLTYCDSLKIAFLIFDCKIRFDLFILFYFIVLNLSSHGLLGGKFHQLIQ